MKKTVIGRLACLLSAAALLAACCGNKDTGSTVSVIKTDVPARPDGQENVIGLRTDPIDTVRIGFVGLGARGAFAVYRYTNVPWTKVVALCDVLPEKVDNSTNFLVEQGFEAPAGYTGLEGYKELCARDDIDLVYICTDWKNHVPMAVYAMQHGKHVAVEVPAATSIEECWQLVDVAEQTQRHCMMLENCCYDFFELTALNMAQQGMFGELIHGEGAYIHNLEPYWHEYYENWRLEFNQSHAGDVYPTHGLGPLCQAFNIHRGDRMKTLVCMSTPSYNGKKIAKELMGVDDFANGDMTTTMIQTEKGKTLLIEHNVYTYRPYNRLYQLTGTEGFANKYPIEGFTVLEDKFPAGFLTEGQRLNPHGFVPAEVRDKIMKEYLHPIAVKIEEKAKEVGGHGGMDFIMDYRLIYCLQHGLPLDQDVYDAAEWSCLGELTAASIANGGMPVQMPDFTRGDWDKVKGYKHAE